MAGLVSCGVEIIEQFLHLEIQLVPAIDDINLWAVPAIPEADSATWPSVLLTLLWRLWDARNGTIFRDAPLAQHCISGLRRFNILGRAFCFGLQGPWFATVENVSSFMY
jgi:hypothetical protein